MNIQDKIDQNIKDNDLANKQHTEVLNMVDKYLRRSLAIRRALLAFDLRLMDQMNQMDLELAKIDQDYK